MPQRTTDERYFHTLARHRGHHVSAKRFSRQKDAANAVLCRRSLVERRRPRQNGAIELVQAKTAEPVAVPIRYHLSAVLAAHRVEHLTFLTTAAGAPFTSAGFGDHFRDACRVAGLPEQCSAHGLRKAACRRLAELGLSPHQIMSISGHRPLGEVERYTREANKKQMAQAAMAALEASSRNDLESIPRYEVLDKPSSWDLAGAYGTSRDRAAQKSRETRQRRRKNWRL
jgi:Phage integrase family